MFALKKSNDKATLEKEIDNVTDALAGMQVTEDDYDKTLGYLERLYKLKTADKGHRKVSADAIIGATSSLAGILFILNYERMHVVASKALGFVMKPKL